MAAPRDITTLRLRNAELETQISQLQAQVIELQRALTSQYTGCAGGFLPFQPREHL